MSSTEHKANALAQESSPYLLQHAYNPVNWYPWGPEALAMAQEQDKPIIVSIGYSSCHWCHVMERESFENEALAALMNEHFICIKVDREERPDVDQIYMDSVHAMGLQGGWPLNVFLTPKQKPFYGGTYFPPKSWEGLLENIASAFTEKRQEVEDSAAQFEKHLNQSEVLRFGLDKPGQETFKVAMLDDMLALLAQKYDGTLGGMRRAPKFPMPSVWRFLLRAAHARKQPAALQQAQTTVNALMNGGIYDQAGGGWARYSVDEKWLVPHFEKMGYDNGQLLSLFAEAYTLTGEQAYKDTIAQTVAWLEREMLDEAGGFYSALDADSEGEEGKFYIWTAEELKTLWGADAPALMDYFQCTEGGNWAEEARNILWRKDLLEPYCQEKGLDAAAFAQTVQKGLDTLMQERAQRVRPGLDDKVLAGWNGLVLEGLAESYAATGVAAYKALATRLAAFLTGTMVQNGQLYRSYKAGKVSYAAYLEDYGPVIKGLTRLYEVTFDEAWLKQAEQLMEYVLAHFYDKEEGFFYYTDHSSEALIARKKELFDNVIPASNSIMATNLHFLGLLLDKPAYSELAREMMGKMLPLAMKEPEYLTHWASLFTYMAQPTAEVAISGPQALEMAQQLEQAAFIPNKVVTGTTTGSELPLLQGRAPQNGQTTIWVCYNKACQLPVHSVEEAVAQIEAAAANAE